MASAKDRVIAGIGANASSQVVTVVIQLVSLPVFLHYWSMPTYGEWLLLSAVPGYFSLADAGLGAVAMNRMTMLVAGGHKQQANEVFQTALMMIAMLSAAALVLSAAGVWLFMNGASGASSPRVTLLLLITLALLNIFSGLFDAVFRASGFFATGIHLLNIGRLLEWLGGMAGLILLGTMTAAAGGFLLGRLAFTAFMLNYSAHRCPDFVWGADVASRHELRQMILPALSFLAFPLGNALSFQGMTILVGSVFGPFMLAVFNTYRTVSRLLVQLLTIFTRSLWPEISRMFGNHERALLRQMYARGTRLAIVASAAACVAVFLLGHWLIARWTGGKVPYHEGLFAGFLAVSLASCSWQVGMVVLQATNNHRRLAVAFVLAAIVALGLAAVLPAVGGLTSAVVALGFNEVVMIVVCHWLVQALLRAERWPGNH